MNTELEINIKRRPDGSIDTAYYMRAGLKQRSEQAHRLAGQVSCNLPLALVNFLQKCIGRIFMQPDNKRQGV